MTDTMTTPPATALGELHDDAGFVLPFRVRLPRPATPRALLVLLHGVGGNETNLAQLAHAAPAGTLVVLARAPHELAPGQYAWFPVRFTPEGPQIDAGAANASRQRLIRFVEQLQHAHGVAPTHTVIAGFSQGGILSASVGLTAPTHVAGFGLLAGRILPELEPHLVPWQQLRTLRAFIGHGIHDEKLPLTWARRAARLLDDLRVHQTQRLYSTGHELGRQMQEDFLRWFTDLVLDASNAQA